MKSQGYYRKRFHMKHGMSTFQAPNKQKSPNPENKPVNFGCFYSCSDKSPMVWECKKAAARTVDF